MSDRCSHRLADRMRTSLVRPPTDATLAGLERSKKVAGGSESNGPPQQRHVVASRGGQWVAENPLRCASFVSGLCPFCMPSISRRRSCVRDRVPVARLVAAKNGKIDAMPVAGSPSHPFTPPHHPRRQERCFMRRILSLTILTLVSLTPSFAAERPNILFIFPTTMP